MEEQAGETLRHAISQGPDGIVAAIALAVILLALGLTVIFFRALIARLDTSLKTTGDALIRSEDRASRIETGIARMEQNQEVIIETGKETVAAFRETAELLRTIARDLNRPAATVAVAQPALNASTG